MKRYKILGVIIGLVSLCFMVELGIKNSCSYAQYWTTLPPYNLLWPLWSPPLSPVDPTPLISDLIDNTILPVQPAIIWDPILNTIYGINPWPPSYLLDVTVPSIVLPPNLTGLNPWL